MTTPYNRALWELVEKWRKESNAWEDQIITDRCANELAAILDRPVVVGDKDVERALAAYKEAHKKIASVTPSRAGMLAALESMFGGKS